MTTKKFIFESYSIDYSTLTVDLVYKITDGPVFVEQFIFEPPATPISDAKKQAIDAAIRLLHLAAGVSYYKSHFGIPVALNAYSLSHAEKAFFDKFYSDGLSEFIYRNDLDYSKAPVFPAQDTATARQVNLNLNQNNAIVPIGGGKDSAVSLEALKNDVTLHGVSVGNHKAIKDTAHSAKVALRHIQRKMSPNLFKLNKAGALNGHVPVTGILSFSFVIEAILSETANIVMSNERSANVGNFVKGDTYAINHQWSKSYDSEIGIHNLVTNHVSNDLNYFSILRPFSELDISRAFAGSKQHYYSFTSCNRVFKIDEEQALRWCCECEKCRFVFLCLACFVDIDTLTRIFGKNILDDENALTDYQAMLGLGQLRKPFECVGEVDEVAVAFSICYEKYDAGQHAILRELKTPFNAAFAQRIDALKVEVFTPIQEHNIPDRFLHLIMKHFGHDT